MIRANAQFLGVILVALWAFRDFHRDIQMRIIRFGTERERYFLGVAVYMCFSLVAYFLVNQVVMAATVRAPESIAKDLPPAMIATIITVALPDVPLVGWLVNLLRKFARVLALYPQAAERLCALLSSARFQAPAGAKYALDHGLRRYGIPLIALESKLSPSVADSLLEVQGVRDRMRVVTSDAMHGRGGAVRRFVVARNDDLQAAEQRYLRLLRRTARVRILGQSAIFEEDELYPLSEFVARGAEDLILRYRTLIAEIALACFGSRQNRNTFIASFGYAAPPEWALPYWPLIVVFCVDLLLFVVPIAMKSMPLPPLALLFSSALAQVIAVAWGIFPKANSNFARPSLYSLPWLSYAVFGCCSYLTGVAISLPMAYANPLPADAFPAKIDSTVLMLLFAIYFPAITITVSVLTDLNLRHPNRLRRSRLADALAAGLAMVCANLLFRLAVLLILHIWLDRPVFAVIFGALGAIIGALIPRTAASYLSMTEIELAPNSMSGFIGIPEQGNGTTTDSAGARFRRLLFHRNREVTKCSLMLNWQL